MLTSLLLLTSSVCHLCWEANVQYEGGKDIYSKIIIYLRLCLRPLYECTLNLNSHFSSALVCTNS